MTTYKHACGQRYERTTQATPPRERMAICGRCFEPMPICDAKRGAFSYRPLKDMSFFRRLMSAKSTPRTTRPVLKVRPPSRALPVG